MDTASWACCLATACEAMCIRTARSNFGEGTAGSGPLNIPYKLRPICTGVRSSPQGNPHQPSAREIAASPNWLLVPHERQEIYGVLLQRVMRRNDITLW